MPKWNDTEPNLLERQRLLKAQGCTNMRVRQTARALTDFYDLVMAPSGLHSNQFTLLIPLHLQPGLTIGQLTQITGLDRTTLARNLDLLRLRQLLCVQPGEDQRTRVIHLTEQGREALKRALPLWEQAQQHVAGALGQAQIGKLYKYLDVLEA